MKKLLFIIPFMFTGCIERKVQKVTETYTTDTTYSISKRYKSGKHYHETDILISKEEYILLKQNGHVDVEIHLPEIFVKNTNGGEDIKVSKQQFEEFGKQHNPSVEYNQY